jgi:hypothetical protein
MAKQQRMVRMEPKGQLAAMQQLEAKSDEELEAETRFRSVAQTILGARAAERFDAAAARAHFQKALASARPQDRMQIRRMADVSLAQAERRTGDLKAGMEKLGMEAPSSRQLFGMRVFGLVAPPKSAGILARIRGILLVIVAIIAVLAVAFGIVKLIALPFGGISLDLSIFYGLVLFLVALGGLVFWGRRRQRAATAKRDADLAARTGR